MNPYIFPLLKKRTQHQVAVNFNPQSKVAIIINIVCDVMQTDWQTINTRSRKKELVMPRHAVAYFLKWYSKLSLEKIGDIFEGGRDHSSIIHSCQVWQDMIETDKDYAKKHVEIEKNIKFKLYYLINI